LTLTTTAAGRFCECVAANLFATNCAADDVSEFRWFAMDELPGAEQIAFEHEKAVLRFERKEEEFINTDKSWVRI